MFFNIVFQNLTSILQGDASCKTGNPALNVISWHKNTYVIYAILHTLPIPLYLYLSVTILAKRVLMLEFRVTYR